MIVLYFYLDKIALGTRNVGRKKGEWWKNQELMLPDLSLYTGGKVQA